MMAHPTLTSIFGNPHPPHIAPTPIPLPRSLSCPLRSLHVTNLLAVLRDSDANLFIFIYFYLLLSHKSQAGSSPSPSLPPPARASLKRRHLGNIRKCHESWPKPVDATILVPACAFTWVSCAENTAASHAAPFQQ